MEITREPDPSSTRSSMQDITSQLSKQMRRLMSRCVTNVKVCDQCQRFSNIPRQPSEYLTLMMASWPFAQWALDILSLFPVGTRQMKFLVNIVCRFGMPKMLVSDHERQFDNTLFRDFCAHFEIQNHYSLPTHPQANGQAEVANRSLLKIIKTQLEGANGVWPDELPDVLWAYRTIAREPLRGKLLLS